MEPIGNVIKQIVKQRNLGDEKTLENQALHDPDVQAFLKQNADKINQKTVSYTHLTLPTTSRV